MTRSSTYKPLSHAIENTASQNTAKPLNVQRFYIQPSYHGPPVCRIDCVDCIFEQSFRVQPPLSRFFLAEGVAVHTLILDKLHKMLVI